MTDETVSDVVAARVKELRKARGWAAVDLAVRCAGTGAPHLTENVIENIESGRRADGRRRRAVTVDELFQLARALDCRPSGLLPGEDGDPPKLREMITYLRGQFLMYEREARERAEAEQAFQAAGDEQEGPGGGER